MAEAVDERMLDRRHDRLVMSARDMRKLVWTDATTQSSSDEQLVVVVGRPVGQDVRLGSDQHADAVQLLVDGPDPLDLAAQLVGRHLVAEAVRR